MGHKDVFKEIFGMNDFTNYAIIIRMEVPPTLDQPASQQGGGGKVEKPDRRSQGGDGGAMVRTGIFWGIKESESFHTERLISITCVLWIGGDNHVPVFSRVEREKRIWMKVFSSLARKGKCLQ